MEGKYKQLTKFERWVFNQAYSFAKRRKIGINMAVGDYRFSYYDGNVTGGTSPQKQLEIKEGGRCDDPGNKIHTHKELNKPISITATSRDIEGIGVPNIKVDDKKECNHESLSLKGHKRPKGLPKNSLYVTDPYLECNDCKIHLGHIPKDLAQIKNIPHHLPEECKHPRSFQRHNFVYTICLCCGYTRVEALKTKLEVISSKNKK